MKTFKIVALVLFTIITNVVLAQTVKKASTKKVVVSKVASYKLDTKLSTFGWLGKKVTGEHSGAMSFQSGVLNFNKTKLVGGEFVVDMNSISSADLQGEYATKLLGHLKSEDFFNTVAFPTATLKITNVVPKENGNYAIVADLIIKGITKPVAFTALVKSDAKGATATAKFNIDRTKYDIKYGSKSFFDNIGDKAIYDDFTIDVKIVASK